MHIIIEIHSYVMSCVATITRVIVVISIPVLVLDFVLTLSLIHKTQSIILVGLNKCIFKKKQIKQRGIHTKGFLNGALIVNTCWLR